MREIATVLFWGGPLDGELRTLQETPLYYVARVFDWPPHAVTPEEPVTSKTIRYRREPTAAGRWRYVYVEEGGRGGRGDSHPSVS